MVVTVGGRNTNPPPVVATFVEKVNLSPETFKPFREIRGRSNAG
jgi:hypothetical protein